MEQTLPKLLKYKKIKRTLAKKFGIDQKNIQRIMDGIVLQATQVNGNDKISTKDILSFKVVESHKECFGDENALDDFLKDVDIIISSDNILYSIEKE
jgi:hypothetical protein